MAQQELTHRAEDRVWSSGWGRVRPLSPTTVRDTTQDSPARRHSAFPGRALPHPGSTPSTGGSKTTRPDKHVWGRPWAPARPSTGPLSGFSPLELEGEPPHSAGPKEARGRGRGTCPQPLDHAVTPHSGTLGRRWEPWGRTLGPAHPHPVHLTRKLLPNFMLLQCFCASHHPPKLVFNCYLICIIMHINPYT